MKKKIIAAVIVVMILASICTGCTNGNNDNSSQSSSPSIVGTWHLSGDFSAPDTLVVYDSGSILCYLQGQLMMTWTYTIAGNSVIITDTVDGQTYTITGTFSATSLTLFYDGNSITYVR